MSTHTTALEVADRIVRWSQQDEVPVTPLQVQKLVYLCQGWSLGFGHGPLFVDAVEAWQYGPVVRAVYHALKRFGRSPVRDWSCAGDRDLSEDHERIIRLVWKSYGAFDGTQLSRMTHADNGPWDLVCQGNPKSQIIPVHVMRDHYRGLAAELLARQQSDAMGGP